MRLPAEMSLGQIASLVGGRVVGDANKKVSNFSESPLHATADSIAAFFDAKLLKRVNECKAAAIVVPESAVDDLKGRDLIVVKRPTLALQKILTALQPKRFYPDKGVHPSAVIDPSAKLAADVCIGPLVYVGPESKIGARTILMAGTVVCGKVEIGDDCVVYPGCMIADYVKIGNRVILQQGASIGADGFAYVSSETSNLERRMAGVKELSDEPNKLLKIPQLGTVILEDDVEIGSNTTIDRATMGATIIRKDAKIDNLVMIAHNCDVGREVLMAGHSGLAGSVKVGDRAVFAGHCGIADHITVGKDAIVEGYAGVMKDIPDSDVQGGIPARPAKAFFTETALLSRLPNFRADVRDLKKRVAQLEQLLLEKQLAKGG